MWHTQDSQGQILALASGSLFARKRWRAREREREGERDRECEKESTVNAVRLPRLITTGVTSSGRVKTGMKYIDKSKPQPLDPTQSLNPHNACCAAARPRTDHDRVYPGHEIKNKFQPRTPNPLSTVYKPIGTVPNLRRYTSQKCAAVLRRARI
jgi:hypothetical protein